MSDQPSNNTLNSCIEIVRKVGEFQLQYFRLMPDDSSKIKVGRETVSFVDVESEKMLLEGLTPLIDGAGFYGEESGKRGSQDLVWVVDPLDGTTNFLSGYDHFSVSVALVKEGEPILGVVHRPSTGETFSSLKGQGVFHNGKKVVPHCLANEASDALFMTGFPYRSEDMQEKFFKTAAEVLLLGRGIRRSGSAALDVANLGAGWLQGFWESDLQPYDIAAGMLMMLENGALVTNERGEPYDMFNDRIMVAAFPKVHEKLLATVAAGYSD